MDARALWRRKWQRLGAVALLVAVAGGARAQSTGSGSLRIESVPTGAEVELIGGRAGVTPLVIGERDIYPNDYPDARADMYGMVELRHPGCQPLQHRVTLTDVKQGLRLNLDCGLPAPPRRAIAAAPIGTAPPPLAAESTSRQRLRQLQVLQELRDEGLITPAEEQRIRRRILDLGDDPGP